VFWGRNYSSGKRLGSVEQGANRGRGEIGRKVIHTTDIILTHGLSQGARRIGPGLAN
jgi:hypothetical protein